MKRLLSDLTAAELRGHRALVRVDYNVPLTDEGEVADTTRIGASLPTLRHLLERGALPVLLSHLGRPGGRPNPDLSLAPVARTLERGLGSPVEFIGSPDTDDAVEATRAAGPGTILLAENVRFLAGETENDGELARRLARLGDLYVDDAFGAMHRTHASVVALARLLRPSVAGLLVEREVRALGALRDRRGPPFVAAFGGAKIGDKVPLFRAFVDRADTVLVGGAMANTFLRAAGHDTGTSLVEEDVLGEAEELLTGSGDRLRLPSDVVVAESPDAPAEDTFVVPVDGIPPDAAALDIGPETRREFAEVIVGARTFFWNGPMGLFERPAFAAGTEAVARAAVRATRDGALTVFGGGDTASAARNAGAADAVSHVSTGGGAALEYLATGTLAGLEVLEDA